MAAPAQRLDKWLWYARFFKSRSLATRFCATGRLRVNGEAVTKAHFGLRVGDVLTFPKAADIRVVRVEDLGTRRGPAPEAQGLYTDLAPPAPRQNRDEAAAAPAPAPTRPRGAGRPTKADRRALDRLRERE
ncbi:MAG: RNA-binding S4 domain-containing protein [Hyphomicrobiales bacterium]|nr:RNA-binding S4 domain-containing protein [Hyphomicrobiales bacterium]MCP5373181.1 RNA-binding S4 domain-containing protein [Hyphomicrobiales bacterium]